MGTSLSKMGFVFIIICLFFAGIQHTFSQEDSFKENIFMLKIISYVLNAMGTVPTII